MLVNNTIKEKSFYKKYDKNIIIFSPIFNDLNKTKSEIDKYKDDFIWDYAKKIINKHELIYITGKYERKKSMSAYHPISRSFFKLHEIIHEFGIKFNRDNIIGVHLAEGPGGFMENISYLKNKNQTCKLYGITLEPTNRHIPSWGKLDDKKCEINISYGNLYYEKDVDNFCSKIKDKKIDIITADGGFDFSCDYNNQEKLYQHICFSEIFTHFNIQTIGGCFICKFFDIFSLSTIQMLYLLYYHYEKVEIYKPKSSRPANSEKYIICLGFKGIKKDLLLNLRKMFREWENDYKKNEYKYYIIDLKIPNYFLYKVYNFNKKFVHNQISIINKTIKYIKDNELDIRDKRKYKTMTHIKKSKEWCSKYNIPTNSYYG